MIHLLTQHELILNHVAAKCTYREHASKVMDVKKTFKFPKGFCWRCGFYWHWGDHINSTTGQKVQENCRFEDLVMPLFWLTYTSVFPELNAEVWAVFEPSDRQGDIQFLEDSREERDRYYIWLTSLKEGSQMYNMHHVLQYFLQENRRIRGSLV
jgi:hypothetical protein